MTTFQNQKSRYTNLGNITSLYKHCAHKNHQLKSMDKIKIPTFLTLASTIFLLAYACAMSTATSRSIHIAFAIFD